MTKWAFIAFCSLVLVACRGDRTHLSQEQLLGNGEFVVPKEDLPKGIVELAAALEKFPRKLSQGSLESLLISAGLDPRPHTYKEQANVWYLDENMKRSTALETHALIFRIFYWRGEEVKLYGADIHRGSFREMAWQIQRSN